jgi:hypothetical protein
MGFKLGKNRSNYAVNGEIKTKLAYGDDFVKYNGVTYPRRTINGKDMIIVDGVPKEAGSHNFPWEKEANNGNDHGNI